MQLIDFVLKHACERQRQEQLRATNRMRSASIFRLSVGSVDKCLSDE